MKRQLGEFLLPFTSEFSTLSYLKTKNLNINKLYIYFSFQLEDRVLQARSDVKKNLTI
jgi:hypothetical protein